MRKLMKYELRKTMFSKLVLLAVTAVVETLFLLGVFLKNDSLLTWGVIGLVCCAMIGIFYIGIESLMVLHRDLNTKQSYMLFLTPQSSYKILGAKVLQNGLSVFLAGVFFTALAAIDITVALLYIGGLSELINFARMLAESISLDTDITAFQAILAFFMMLAEWLQMLTAGDLAIVLSATVFAGRKFSGAVSLFLYLILGFGLGRLTELIPETGSDEAQMCLTIIVTLAIVALLYAVTGWIMEKKLSV